VLVMAVGSIGAFLEVFLPQQIGSLARLEASEMQLARKGAADASTSANALWSDLAKGSIGLSDQQLATDLSLAKQTQKTAADALTHAQAAQAYMAQADGMPFQFHSPAFVVTDRPALTHLQKALTGASRLATAASLQIAIAQNMNQNTANLAALNASLIAHDWSGGARLASTLAASVKLQQNSAADPDALLDPLWGKWIDGMESVAIDAQQYCLASAQKQPALIAQDGALLAGARNQMTSALAAAQNDAVAWQSKTIQPLLQSLAAETSAAGS
jgi:hypothetical protein